MRKKLLLKEIGAILLLGFLFAIGGLKVEAAERPLLQYPEINVVDKDFNTPNIIPADYATVIRPNYRMSYTVVGDSKWTEKKDYAEFKTPSANSYVQLNNAAIYHGEYVDLRLTFVEKEGNTSKVYIFTPAFETKNPKKIRDNFLRVNVYGSANKSNATIKYEFLKHGTEEHIDYSGTWNYRNINKNKRLNINKQYIESLYAYYHSEIYYEYNNTKELEVVGHTSDIETDKKKYNNTAFSMLFDTNDGVMYQKISLHYTQAWTKYDFDPIAQMELPTPQVVGETTDMPKIEFNAIQDMPKQLKDNFYPWSYSLFVKLKEPDIIDWATSSLDVVDAAGNTGSGVRDYFEFSRDIPNDQLVISTDAATLRNPDFVDNSYEFQIKGNLKKGANAKLGKYYESDGYYHIPIYAQYKTNTNTSPQSSGIAKVKADISADPIAQKVPQYSNTSNWKNRPISELFNNPVGAYDGDDLVIDSVENKTFSGTGPTTVKVVLKGSKSGIKKEFNVPVTVMEEKTATIHYIDQDGNSISSVATEKGFEGEAYDFTSKITDIPNYTYVGVDGKGKPIKGTFGADKTFDVYLKYQLNDQKVTVKHLDSNGTPIAPESEGTFKPNTDHTFNSVKVPGYQVVSAKVGNTDKALTPEGNVVVSLKDKPVTVTFTYKSVHFSLAFDANKTTVPPRGTIDYSLDVVSGMAYPVGTEATDYNALDISIPVDPNITDISDIKLVNASGVEVGVGQYDPASRKVSVSLTQSVKDTEDLKVTYRATVSNTVVAGDKIKAQASVSAKYQVNGQEQVITRQSNLVEVSVKDSSSKTITIHYVDGKGKEIKTSETEVGKELQSYDFEDKTKVNIPGYKFVEVDETKGLPIKGIYPAGNGGEDIYLVYELAELEVKVNYVDENGAKISPEKSTTVISTQKKTIDSVGVPGYKVKTVKVDNKEEPLIDNSKVEITGKENPISVIFIYESIHFKLKLTSNTSVVPPNGTVKYTLTATSGMTFKEGETAPNYKDVAITIPVDPQISNITNIKVVNDKDEVIGEGQFDKTGKQITATLTKAVKSTETIKVTYSATAANDAAPGGVIKTTATMKAKYEINGAEKEISGDSNEVLVTIKTSEQKEITIHYVDPTGKKIADEETELGNELQPYDFTEKTKKKISGYKYVKVDESKGLPIKGTFSAGNKAEDIYIVYELDELPVTVNYVDGKSNNRKIWKSTSKDVKVGSTFKLKAEQIPGFKAVEASVNDVKLALNADDAIEFVMPEKATEVNFIYEPAHMKVTIKADKAVATQTEEIKVVGNLTSLMKYPDGLSVENYSDDFVVTIQTKNANQNADAISDIVLKTESGDDVTGKVETFDDYVTVGLSKKVKDTENLIVTFKTKVKEDGVTGEHIKYGLDVESTYKLYTDKADDKYVSKVSAKELSDTLISGSVRLVEAPKTIDFGELTYTGSAQRLDKPTVNGKLAVVDSRKGSKNWSLQVSVPVPLKDGNLLLPAKLRYKTDSDDYILSSASREIYVNDKQQDRVVISDEWKKGGKGVSLEVGSEDMLKKGNYSGTVRWTVVEAEN